MNGEKHLTTPAQAAYRLAFLDHSQVIARQPEIVSVYRNAFQPPPYDEDEGDVMAFAEWLSRHTLRQGFRMLAAIDFASDRVIGFAYGYTSLPGQWWYDVVARALEPSARVEWMADAFELVELAVDPAWQGHKLGSQLHDRLLESVTHRTALLSTVWVETSALHLYQNRGWQTLLEKFTFPGVVEPYRVMGLTRSAAYPSRPDSGTSQVKSP